MVEYFYNFLALHHLFDVSVYFCNGCLLLDEVLSGESGELSCSQKHDSYHRKRHYRKRYRENYHRYENRYDHDGRVDDLRYRLAYHLAQRIDIIRVKTHDVTVRMRVKISDRQVLHMHEHRVSEISLHSLRHVDHDVVVDVGRDNSENIERHDFSYRAEKWRKIRCMACCHVLYHRRDVAVDKRLHEHRSLNVAQHTYKNKDYD